MHFMKMRCGGMIIFFFFQAEDGIRDLTVTGVQTCALPIFEGAQEIVEFPLPAVLTVDEGLNTARLPSLKGIMAAKKKPLDVKPTQLQPPQVTVRKLELPAERKAGRVVGEGAAAGPELGELLQTEARVL